MKIIIIVLLTIINTTFEAHIESQIQLYDSNKNSQQKPKQKQPWLQKIIWTYWTQKISEDDHIRRLFQLNHKMQQKGWQLRHVSNQNLYYWLNQIPDFGDKLQYPQFKNYKHHVRSNLIRLALIKHFGGVYLDFTTILTSSLDWLLNLESQDLVSDKFGTQPNLVLLYSYHTQRQTYFDQQLEKNVLIYPSFQNFFLAGKKGEGFLQDWFDFYVEAKNISQKKYPLGQLTQDSWIVQTALKQKIKVGGFSGKYFEVAICGQIVLQRKQKQFDRVWQAYNKKTNRPLAVKYYNIWSMQTNKVAYQIQNLVTFGFLQFIFVLMQSDKDYIQNYGVHGKHFIKLFNQNTVQLNKFFLTQISAAQIPCPQNYYILENSLGYQYLLKNYPIKFYTNILVNVSYNRYCLTMQQQKMLKFPQQIQFINNNFTNPNSQIKIGAQFRKFTQAVQLIQYDTKQEIQSLQNQIKQLANKNQQISYTKKFIQEAISTNQLNYQKIDKTIQKKLNQLSQKQCAQMDKLISYHNDMMKNEQLKDNIFYFVILAVTISYIVFGTRHIIHKIRKIRKRSQYKQCQKIEVDIEVEKGSSS